VSGAVALHLAGMKLTRGHFVVLTAVVTTACATADPGLMSFREYAARIHTFPQFLQIQTASGALFYYGAEHTNDPANPQIAEIQRLCRRFVRRLRVVAAKPGHYVHLVQPDIVIDAIRGVVDVVRSDISPVDHSDQTSQR
jgi:hypothetical protein